MKNKRSILADEIVNEWVREKQWKEKAERMKQMQQNRITILAENSRNPIILEEKVCQSEK